MKRFVLALTLLALMLALCLYTIYDLYNKKNNLINILDEMKKAAESGNFEKARDLSVNFNVEWEKAEHYLIRYIRRHPLDNITAAAAKMTAYAKYKSASDFISETDSIKIQIINLWELELPLLRNFF